ncbi:MAG: diacylglycerol kinase family lipid kinase [Coprothermobacterota bacterium]|nr:diacylglycerol kinase family lipid kinase [Coprothermobacterota bacterium]
MGKRAFLALNPEAGSGSALTLGEELRARLAQAAWEVRIHRVHPGENLSSLVREEVAESYDLFCAAGGDGTVAGVAGGLVGMEPPLAILPCGTGNVLARDLGIPLEGERALELILGPHDTRSIDAMQVGERYFFLNMGIGLNASVVRDTSQREKRLFGTAAYVWTAVSKAIFPPHAAFRVTIDGQESRFPASDLIVANSTAIGGPLLRLDPQARLDDGRLEVFSIFSKNLIEYLLLTSNVLLGWQRIDRHLAQREAYYEVRVEADPPLPVQADGEELGETPVYLRLAPRAVRVVVPVPKPEERRMLEAFRVKTTRRP